MMNLKLYILAVVLLCASAALADDLTIKKIPPYSDVSIMDVKDGMISFRVASGVPSTKSVADILSVALKDNDDINQAEKLFVAGKFADAVKQYDAAAKKTRPDTWAGRLIRYRRLTALDQAKMIDKAVVEWLAMLDESGAKPGVLDLRPRNAAAKGAKENTQAIATLEAKQSRDAAVAGAIKQALLDLYQAEGLKDKAGTVAGEIASSTTNAPDSGKSSGEGGDGQIKAADVLLSSGDPAKALATMQDNLGRYGGTDLAAALLVMGKAQMALAEKASDDAAKRKALLEAGLNLMRVYTYYGSLSEAGEALYLAGKVNESLGNKDAAGKAYEKVVSRYANSDAAAKAKSALTALPK